MKRDRAKKADTESEATAPNASPRLHFGGEWLDLTPTADFPIQLLETEQYGFWIDSVSDPVTKARVTNNVDKMRRGLLGDWKEVGGVFEMRLDFGPGYRVYYARYGQIVIILLGGGDKSSQRKDVADAQRLWEGLKREITQI